MFWPKRRGLGKLNKQYKVMSWFVSSPALSINSLFGLLGVTHFNCVHKIFYYDSY